MTKVSRYCGSSTWNGARRQHEEIIECRDAENRGRDHGPRLKRSAMPDHRQQVDQRDVDQVGVRAGGEPEQGAGGRRTQGHAYSAHFMRLL
jgi:hypothetical protein